MGRRSRGNMICLQLTLLFLLLWQGSCLEPEPVFRPVGSVVEMGYCFGEDYIVVYRVVPGEDQLLGNSSLESPPVTPPSDLQGRVHTSQNHQLLGLQIKNLTHGDSGTYRRECWKNQTLVKHYTQELTVCDSELESHEIFVNAADGGAEILCESPAIGQEDVSVRWYHDIFPTYIITPLLDSRISLDPVDGILQVKNNGAKLVLDKNMLSNNQHFYCLVYKETQCLSFQDLYMPESLESRDIFASHGDKVVLYCKEDGNNQYWETPTGRVESLDDRSHHMFISTGFESEHYSLIIPNVLDKHFGDYSCVSSAAEMQYSLVLCPKKSGSEVFTFENQEVTLSCDIGQADSYMVQWYRRQKTGQQELIYDSGDDSVLFPEDLKGRVKIYEDDSELTISNMDRTDEGLYWCVVIKGAVFIEDDDDYVEEYEEEEGEEDDNLNSDWEDKCLFKQETFVSVREILSVTSEMLPAPKPNNERAIMPVSQTPQPLPSGRTRTRAVVELVLISVFGIKVL